MISLIIELPDDIYMRLRAEAECQGKTPEVLAREIIIERILALPDPIAEEKGTRPIRE